MCREDRSTAGAGSATHPGDDEERVDLVNRDAIDRALYFADVLLGNFGAEFVVGADTVALDACLTDQDSVPFRNSLESVEIRRCRVDRDRRFDESAIDRLVVREEFVDDLPACLTEAD